MKKWICTLLIVVFTLSSASMAFAAGMPDDTKTLFSQAKAERDKVKEMRNGLKEKAAALKTLFDQLKADAGIIALTDDEKALLESVKQEIAPLTEQIKTLREQLKTAIASSDKEQEELLRQQISDIKTLIADKWAGLEELRDKVKSNHEKRKTFVTDDIKTLLANRKEFREQAKLIRDGITALLGEIRTARSQEDYDTVNQKIDQLMDVMLEAENNILGRTDILDNLISALSN